MVTRGDGILRSPFPAQGIPTCTVYQALERAMVANKDKIAVRMSSGNEEVTYGDLNRRSQTLAYNLYEHGLRHGDVIAVFLPNCLECVYVLLAAGRLGLTFALINPLSTAKDVTFYLKMAGAKWLATGSPFTSTALEGAKGTNIKSIINHGDHPDCVPLSAMMKPIPAGHAAPRGPDIDTKKHVSFILFSSGTTGLPKAVQLTDYAFFTSAILQLGPTMNPMSEWAILFMPLSHIYGYGVLCGVLYHQGSLILLPKFDLEDFLSNVSKYKMQSIMLVPPLVVMLAKHPLVDKYDLSSVKVITVGAAPLSRESEQEVRSRLGGKVMVKQMYGMTECGGLATGYPAYDSGVAKGPLPPGSVGVPSITTELKFVDPDSGNTVSVNQPGEIWIRSAGLMVGYMGNPQATSATIDKDGWLHSGDIGYYDENGYVFIVDRVKELIKYKGNQVAPAELEALILTHPLVADVGVIGLPDTEAGELPQAWVALKAGAKATEKEIMDFVEGAVSPYKKLRGGVRFVSEIPKTPSGKIMRRLMRESARMGKL